MVAGVGKNVKKWLLRLIALAPLKRTTAGFEGCLLSLRQASIVGVGKGLIYTLIKASVALVYRCQNKRIPMQVKMCTKDLKNFP